MNNIYFFFAYRNESGTFFTRVKIVVKVELFYTKNRSVVKVPCEQQVLIELAINSGDFW
jgi:hypothetical protein